MDYLLILIGFVVLIVGAHFLVDGASGLAKRFNISNLVIGLTVVALGTSAPELVVNLVAAAKPDTTDIALTNIIGSNTINVFVILGLSALIAPIKSQRSSRRFDIPMSTLAPIAVIFLCWVTDDTLSRIDGLLLLGFFIWFMFTTIRRSLKHPETAGVEDVKPMKIWMAIIMITGGLAALIFGADLIVPSAVSLAGKWGVSQSVIGLTIVALGTSLPELATSVVAAFKKNSDIALGNVVGSNIFNMFFILGTSAVVRPLPGYAGMLPDLILVTLSTVLVFIFVQSNSKHEIKRWQGASLLLIYSAYLCYTILKPETI